MWRRYLCGAQLLRWSSASDDDVDGGTSAGGGGSAQQQQHTHTHTHTHTHVLVLLSTSLVAEDSPVRAELGRHIASGLPIQ